MIDPTAGRPRGPIAFWVSFRFPARAGRPRNTVTILALLDGNGTITYAPGPCGWAKGKRFTALHRYARHHDPDGAQFAWVDADGTVGEVWS